ncbi:glycosyltransferase, partial [Salmonella enterica]|uniref:glycosyltransferase n=1 Tax=Salmonella enterica TaxID=28901 RepID=UPI003CEB29CE
VDAFRRTQYAKARLQVYGWSETPALAAYGRELKRLAGDDTRITFVPEQAPAAMPAAYAGLSLLAIPSVWLETGPLTLLEALQSGVPFFGS